MTTAVDCLPCLLRQALDTIKRLGMSVESEQLLMQQILLLLGKMDMKLPAPIFGQHIHQLIREHSGNTDPFREIKAAGNSLAYEWFPSLQQQISAADDPLGMAIRTAIAGNIIDYGAKRQVEREDIATTLERALEMPLDEAVLSAFRQGLADARSILYLADNAGEIVFDRLLIEQLPMEKVTLVVRGAPVINDVTREDALAVGLDKLVTVIDNGCDIPGTVLDATPDDFQHRFADADIIIAKGQGNFETLYDVSAPVYYLFVAKCEIVASLVGCAVNTPVFCSKQLLPSLVGSRTGIIQGDF